MATGDAMQQGMPLLNQSDDAGRRPPPAARRNASPGDALPLETSVLVIEDEALIAWMVHDMLEAMGFADVRLARDANEALALSAERHPGLLICDINLGPGEDGVAAAARIRARGHAAVLFITGYAGAEIRSQIDQAVAGAPLLRKPIEFQTLSNCLRQVLMGPKPH
jgi:CheY-like chemotaxis protein